MKLSTIRLGVVGHLSNLRVIGSKMRREERQKRGVLEASVTLKIIS